MCGRVTVGGVGRGGVAEAPQGSLCCLVGALLRVAGDDDERESEHEVHGKSTENDQIVA